jgi:hypothetical protein
MLRDENGHSDEDDEREKQRWCPDATAPWVKVPRIVGVGHLREKHRSADDLFTRFAPASSRPLCSIDANCSIPRARTGNRLKEDGVREVRASPIRPGCKNS